MSDFGCQDWSWPDGKRLALSIVVNVETGASACAKDESVASTQHFSYESNYQYGLNAGFARIAAQLEDFSLRATFTGSASTLEQAPHIARYIADFGHEACFHLGRSLAEAKANDSVIEGDFIGAAVARMERMAGVRPYGWVAGRGFSKFTALLAEAGFCYHMDSDSEDGPFWDQLQLLNHRWRNIVVLPYALDSSDLKFYTAPSLTSDAWLQYAIDTFDVLREESEQDPKLMSLDLHLQIIGRPGRIGALRQFLQYVSTYDDVWVATRLQIARHFAQVCPEPPLPQPA